MTKSTIPACRTDELQPNQSKAFDIDGSSVLICRTEQGFYAVRNRCSHAESPLEGGRIRGNFIFCPLHAARFDLRTGATAGSLTKEPIKTYPVRIEGDAVFVDADAG